VTEFEQRMDDDLNTPDASDALIDLARAIQGAREEGLSITEAQTSLRTLAGILGLTLELDPTRP
jgi:cysteinyl-tRNA synthetase